MNDEDKEWIHRSSSSRIIESSLAETIIPVEPPIVNINKKRS